MTSKYAQSIAEYREQVKSQQSFTNGNLNFIGVTKANPKIYVQLLSNELVPIPMHQFVPVPQDDGTFKNSNFICRKFVHDDCYICDHMKTDKGEPLKPKTVNIVLAAQLADKSTPVYEDVTADKKTAESIFEQFDEADLSNINAVEEGDNIIFKDLPKVGVLQANRTMDQYFALTLSEAGSIDDRSFMIKREGTGLQTKYSIMSVGDAPLDPDDVKLKIALAIHMSLDDYIDVFISKTRYDNAFSLSDLSEKKDDEDSEEESNDDSNVTMAEIMQKYRGASSKFRGNDA